MLKLLIYCVLLHTVFGQSGLGFGTSYLKNSRLCHQWTCINSKLGFSDSLPPKEQFISTLKTLLPPNSSWQYVAQSVADKCYDDRPRRYTNTCPGQALMHCAVEHLIHFCPEESLRKGDACAPVNSLAGFKYMFSQSRYDNFEKNLPTEKRPTWFLKNYFSSKCCNLPMLFNSTVIEGCGFNTMIFYHVHDPKIDSAHSVQGPVKLSSTTARSNVERVKVVDMSVNTIDTTSTPAREHVKVVHIDETVPNMNLDPLECCDLSGFIEPSWRSECGFQMTWNERYRLTILNNTAAVSTTVAPTTTQRPKWNDVKVVPQSCDKETCVFRKLNIISDDGSVNLDAFSKLLDNVTAEHKSWIKAKARVVTKCLSKPIRDYADDCEINKVLACTFDVLSENCPHTKKHDPCKHTSILKDDITCQISSSKFRPKNRRQFCGLPSLVNHEVLTECGLSSLSRMEYVADPVTSKPKTHWWTKSHFACQGSTDSTKCLLSKMGVLNKYGFLDYFKTKDRIRTFTSQHSEWSSLTDLYLSSFTGTPMYGQMCSTPKKLLNVLDVMLMTCPISKRTPSLQCNRILTDIADTAPADHRQIREKLRDFWTPHMMLPPPQRPLIYPPLIPFQKLPVIPEEPVTVTQKNPLYDFGLLSSSGAPKVEVIDVKPNTTKKPLVLLPVYLRMKGVGTFSVRPYNGIMRNSPTHSPMPVSQPLPH